MALTQTNTANAIATITSGQVISVNFISRYIDFQSTNWPEYIFYVHLNYEQIDSLVSDCLRRHMTEGWKQFRFPSERMKVTIQCKS